MSQSESGMNVSHGEVKKFYDSEYYKIECKNSSLPWHMRLIANRLGDLSDKRALDVACGNGEWLAELSARGAKIAGIDISARAVECCHKRFPDADIHEGIAEALPFKTGHFDLVTCLGSLEHFLDQPKTLIEMRRVAKPDAQLLILVPNAGFLTRRIGLYGGTQQQAIRETVRPIAEWRRLFTEAGLTVIDTWRDLHPLSFGWITNGPVWRWPMRAAQAVALAIWPVNWQYQVYFLCRANGSLAQAAV